MKIGIIDDGIDQTPPYFSTRRVHDAARLPEGQTAYTTAKVIVARAFAPAGTDWKYAGKPFDPVESGHATHVAGIAAGNAGTPATGGATVSGVAPRAYIGNYKALTRPDRRRRRARRQRRRDRRRDRGGRRGRHGRDQPLDRRAGGGAVARPRRARARRRRRRRRRPGRRGRERLRRVRPRLAVLAGHVRPRRSPSPPSRARARPGTEAGRLQRGGPDAALAPAEARHQRAGRLDPLVRARQRVGGDVRARRWRRPRSPAPRRCCANGIPTWSVAQLKAALVGPGTAVERRRPVGAADSRRRRARRPVQGGRTTRRRLARLRLLRARPSRRHRPARVDLADTGGGAGVVGRRVDTVAARPGASLTVPPTVTVPGPARPLGAHRPRRGRRRPRAGSCG